MRALCKTAGVTSLDSSVLTRSHARVETLISNFMIATAKCQHCGNEFEFEAGNRTEFCPHCGKETLVIPPENLVPPPAETRLGRRTKWGWLWITVSLVTISVLIYFFGWRIGDAMLEIFPFVGSAVGGLILFIVSVITFILGVLWTFFPWFVYFKMERMNRLLEKIEQNTRR
jgi:predicted Zn-ribbon and HTH transcriptional regulator